MAIKKKENKTIFMLSTVAVLMHASLISAVNFDCKGKAFYCLNSTHFMICVDLGDGITKTVDDFLVPCPPPTVCMDSNFYECEYRTTSTTELPTSLQITLEKQIEDEIENNRLSSISEDAEMTTIIPFWYNRNIEKSEQYYYTENTLSEKSQYSDLTEPIGEKSYNSENPTQQISTTVNYLASESTNIQNEGTMAESDLTITQQLDYSLPTDTGEILENMAKDDFSLTTKNYGDYFDTVSTTTLAEYSSTASKSDNLLKDVKDTVTTSFRTPPNSDNILTTILAGDIALKSIKAPEIPIFITSTTDPVTTNVPPSVVKEKPTTVNYNLHEGKIKKKTETTSGNEDYFVTTKIHDTTSNSISDLPLSTDSEKSFVVLFGPSEDPGTENFELHTASEGLPVVDDLLTTMSNYEYLSSVTTTSSPKHFDVMRYAAPEEYGNQEEITTKYFATASGLPQEAITEGYSSITDFSELEKNILMPMSLPSFEENYNTEGEQVAKNSLRPDSSTKPSYLTIINEVDIGMPQMTNSIQEPITETYSLFREQLGETSPIIATNQNYEEHFNIDSTRGVAENSILDALHKPIKKTFNIFTTTKEMIKTNYVIDTLNPNKDGYFDHATTETSTEQYNSNITNLSVNKELSHITLLNNKSTQDPDIIAISLPDVSSKTIPKSDNLFTDTNSFMETNIFKYLNEYYYGNDDTVTKTNEGTLMLTVTDDPQFVTKIPWPLSIQEKTQGTELKENPFNDNDIPHKVNGLDENTYFSGTKSSIMNNPILESQHNMDSQFTTMPSEQLDFISNIPYTELYEPVLKENTIQDTSTVFPKLKVTENLNSETATQIYPLTLTLKYGSNTQSDNTENTNYDVDNILTTPTLNDSPKFKDAKTISTPDNHKLLSNPEDKSKQAHSILTVPLLKDTHSFTYHAESSTINLQPVYDDITYALEVTKNPLTTLANEMQSLMANEQSVNNPYKELSTKLLLNASTEVHYYKVTTANIPLIERYESILNVKFTTMDQPTDFKHKSIPLETTNNDVTKTTGKSETEINAKNKIYYNYVTSTDTANIERNGPIEIVRTRPFNENVGLTTHPLFNFSPEDVSTVTNMDRSEVVSNIGSTVFTNFNVSSDIKKPVNISKTNSLYFHNFDDTMPNINHEKGVEKSQIKQYESQIKTTIEKSVPDVNEDILNKNKNIICNSTKPKVKEQIPSLHNETPNSNNLQMKFQNISVMSSKEPLNSTIAVERNVSKEIPAKAKLNSNITSDGLIPAPLEIHKNITFEQGPSKITNIILTQNTTYSTKYEENNNPHNTTLKQSASNIVRTTLAPLIHLYGFNCSNLRGKYSDEHNCNKFYICIGSLYPIIGECPINTVFSDILKQCTRNLSHCVRRNQFQCTSAGRFSDIFARDVYYICVRNKNKYVRFKLRCQKGYILNKESVTCIEDTQLLVLSSKYDSISKGSSSSSVDSRSVNNQEKSSKIEFECVEEGTFADPYDCKSYYRCTKTNKSEFRRRKKKCDSDEVFHKRKKKCVDAESYEC